jgi:hypothetical protein
MLIVAGREIEGAGIGTAERLSNQQSEVMDRLHRWIEGLVVASQTLHAIAASSNDPTLAGSSYA